MHRGRGAMHDDDRTGAVSAVRRIDFSEAGETVAKRLLDLLRLPPGWDGYGARPVSLSAASRAASVATGALKLRASALPEPFIAPTPDGGLQLEWKSPQGKELILEIPPGPGEPTFLLVEPTTSGEERETQGTIGQPHSLRELLLRFSR